MANSIFNAVPSRPDIMQRTDGGVRRGLLADVRRIVGMAVGMCGGMVPGEHVDEWQAWVRAVGREIEAHVRARGELMEDLAVAVRTLNDFAAGPRDESNTKLARAALKRIKNRGIVQP